MEGGDVGDKTWEVRWREEMKRTRHGRLDGGRRCRGQERGA